MIFRGSDDLTKQQFFFTKVAPVQSIIDIVLLCFSLILLPGMFVSYYIIIYFFVKNFFFECLYFSEYDIRMFLFVFWLRNRPSIKYTSCVRTHLHLHLSSCFSLMLSCFICRNSTLPLFKMAVFIRNGYFSPMRSISVVTK